MKRKILTLEEVLNLDRCPTLQEMVDLTIEDYAMYLYKKEIIEREPVEDDFEKLNDCTDFSYKDNKYNYINDEVSILIAADYEPLCDRSKSPFLNDDDMPENYLELWNVPDNFDLKKSKEWSNPNIIEKGTIYSKHWGSIEYSINNDFILTLYEKNLAGKYWLPTLCDGNPLYYLTKYYDKQNTSNRKIKI